MKRLVVYLLACLLAGGWLPATAVAAEKVALISTSFVLERKFVLLAEAAKKHGIELAWVQVDKSGEDGVRAALDGARFVIVDAPRADDRQQITRAAGAVMRKQALPTANINVMSAPQRLTPENLDPAKAQRLFDYYVGGTRQNHDLLFAYLKNVMAGGNGDSVPPPVPLPNGGVYHGGADAVFATTPEYLTWYKQTKGKDPAGRPVIAIETSSSYISDGQTRMLDEMIGAIEERDAIPLVFFRSSRVGRANAARASGAPAASSEAVQAASPPANAASTGGRPGRPAQTTDAETADKQAATSATPASEGANWRARRQAHEDAKDPKNIASAFPNPKLVDAIAIDEPLVVIDGKLLPNVLIVNTFIGGDPERRKAWHQAMGVPVLSIIAYRQGDRAAYAKDKAGVNSFSLPFTLTQSEYIGMQDPVVLTTNERGELVSMPEQMDLLMGKAFNLARLQVKPNAEKKAALLFWNHPPGEKNQGASNLNVPRSIEHLVSTLRPEGYAFDQPTEQQIIDTVAEMLRPKYRSAGLADLMKTPHWDFLPLDVYRRWYATIPEAVRTEIEKRWGAPEKSQALADRDGVRGFVIPRMKLGNLVVMPQPSRGEGTNDEEEKKLVHDDKVPLTHSYMATYLWIRERFAADAIIHFGTHGSQEWTPGKERGMWAYDYPNLLVGNTPVIYPYIVDNISEAIHVKRRGRGVIVSHQTPAFAPAGLSNDFVRINDLLREYQSLDEGLVKQSNRRLIVEQARKMNIHKDLKWDAEKLEKDFDGLVRDLEDYLEDLGAAQQPLGLHTFGKEAEQDHMISNVMQMLGQPLYEATGVKSAKAAFRGDYKELKNTKPYQFVQDAVFGSMSIRDIPDEKLRPLAGKGRRFAKDLRADWETKAAATAFASRWIDPSYGGDPIRNPDALHTGRNMYGFDPGRVPTKAAYEAGKAEMERLIETHTKTHGRAPRKLTFTVWSTETMRHLGMLEGQILAAMGARPVWDEGGRVVGVEAIPAKELGRPRVDTVISITGLYRDQFPNVMERLNEAVAKVAALDEAEEFNPLRANSFRVEKELLARKANPNVARQFALTRIFGNQSGTYGTGLPMATLKSNKWDETDGQLAEGYLMRMSWAFGPDTSMWSEKATDASGKEVNVYAEHLRGTDAAVFSRSSNLRGLLDTDHPFEYLGGISLAVKHLDGKNPQLYISNMRDPTRAKLETAEKFMATELRAVYQHPRWIAEMQKEGYAGTLKMLDVINNFWGWQAMDRNVVRDDQWQEFHESYIKDRYDLKMREWFDKSNPTAMAQIAERMLEAIRKDYWRTDEQTRRELVALYTELQQKHDVVTDNETFKTYVAEQAAGFGLEAVKPQPTPVALQMPQTPPQTKQQESQPQSKVETVTGQQMAEVKPQEPLNETVWQYLAVVLSGLFAGMAWQAGSILRSPVSPSTAKRPS